MAIFTRRDIQKGINDLSGIIPRRKLIGMVNALNLEVSAKNEKRFVEALATEWEIVILSALNKIGKIEYEKKTSNGKRPDITFLNGDCAFIGDISAVSDEEQNKKTPIKLFEDTLRNLYREYNTTEGGFDWRVESIELKRPFETLPPRDKPRNIFVYNYRVHGRSIVRHLLPPINNLEQWVRKKLTPFFEMIAASPQFRREIYIEESYDEDHEVQFFIKYIPNIKYTTGSYPSHTSITDAERHIIWRRLEDKRNQFSGMRETAPRIVFICDADCGGIRRSSGGTGNDASDLIAHFWEHPGYHAPTDDMVLFVEDNISAVVTYSIKEPLHSIWNRGEALELDIKIHANHHASYPIDNRIQECLEKLSNYLPTPMQEPYNALHSIKHNPLSTRRLGNQTYHGNTAFTFSVLRIQEILAGTLDPKDYIKHDFKNVFNRTLSNMQLTSAPIIPADAKDDNAVKFVFETVLQGDIIQPKCHFHRDPGNQLAIPLTHLKLILAGKQKSSNLLGEGISNPFFKALIDGLLIRSITIGRDSQQNTMIAKFFFGERDAAISRFQTPITPSAKH